MTAPTITALPALPTFPSGPGLPDQPGMFIPKFLAYLTALNTYRTELNALAAYLDGLTVDSGDSTGDFGDMFAANNLSDLANVAAARANLGLVIGTNVQAYDADLAAIAALADPNADRILFWDDSAGAFTWLSLSNDLEISGTTLGIKSGSAFPSSPVDGQQFRHTGQKRNYFWDSSVGASGHWLSDQEFEFPVYSQQALNNVSASTFQMEGTILPYTQDYDLWVYSIAAVTVTNSANNAANYMTVNYYHVTNSAGTLIGSFTTQNDANTTSWSYHELTVNAALSKNAKQIHLDAVETGTVTQFSIHAMIGCRLIGV